MRPLRFRFCPSIDRIRGYLSGDPGQGVFETGGGRRRQFQCGSTLGLATNQARRKRLEDGIGLVIVGHLDPPRHLPHHVGAAGVQRFKRSGGFCGGFDVFADHRLGGDHQAGHGGRVLQRAAHDLGRIDDAGLDQVLEGAGLGVKAVVVLVLFQRLAGNDGTIFAAVGRRSDAAG